MEKEKKFMIISAEGKAYYFKTFSEAARYGNVNLKEGKYFFYWIFKIGESKPRFEWSY